MRIYLSRLCVFFAAAVMLSLPSNVHAGRKQNRDGLKEKGYCREPKSGGGKAHGWYFPRLRGVGCPDCSKKRREAREREAKKNKK
jgi:hypothetical protein